MFSDLEYNRISKKRKGARSASVIKITKDFHMKAEGLWMKHLKAVKHANRLKARGVTGTAVLLEQFRGFG